MPRKYSDRSTTSESPIASTEAPEEVAEVAATEPEAAPEAEAAPAPKVKPMGGMIEKRWNGQPMWHCPRCGHDTFDPTEAKTHTCNGRAVRPYEGDRK